MSLPSAADAALVDRARAGDRDAFAALYKRYKRAIAGKIGQTLGGNRQDIEDVTQETFTRAWAAIGRYEPKAEFSDWLYAIARNILINRYRKIKTWGHEDELLPTERAKDSYRGAEAALDLERADFSGLTEQQRRVLWLRYVEGYGWTEIGHIMGLSAHAANITDLRARAKLRERLRE